MSALSALAQSGIGNAPPATDGIQTPVGQSEQPLLVARADGVPAAAVPSDDSGLPDAPSAAQPEASASQPAPAPSPAPVRRSSQGAPVAASGGPFGVDHTVADWKYWTLTSAMFSASVFDAQYTYKCLQQKTCAFLPDAFYSRAAMYGVGIPADLAISYLTFHMKKKNSRIWYVPSALVTVANFYVGIHSYGRVH